MTSDRKKPGVAFWATVVVAGYRRPTIIALAHHSK